MDFASQFQGVLIRAFSPSFSFAVPSLSLSLPLSPSFRLSLSPSGSRLPSVVTSSSGDALRTKRSFQPLPCVFYVREISQEFAYMQITSRWFEISHHQICSRQPYRFRFSALQARHVRARFECPGTLRPLPSQFVCLFVGGSFFFSLFLYTAKGFQVLLFNTSSSIEHYSFFCTELNGQTVLFDT